MSSLEKFFRNQLHSHQCQLPPSDDIEFLKQTKKLKNVFLISENSLKAYLKVGSLSAIYYEKRRQVRTSGRVVVHPFSTFRMYWQFACCIFLFICVIWFPLYASFFGPFYAKLLIAHDYEFDTFYGALVITFFFQMLCIVEIAINFMTGYVASTTNEIVIQPTAVVRHYFCTYFIFDFLSAFPIDILLLAALGMESYSEMSRSTVMVLNILFLLKLACLPTLLSYFYNVFAYFFSSYSIYNMVVLCFTYFLTIHWCACAMMLLPRWIHFDCLLTKSNSTIPPHSSYSQNGTFCNQQSWLAADNLLRKNVFIQYFSCAYRSLTCFSTAGFEVDCLLGMSDKIISLVTAVLGKLYLIVHVVVFIQMLSTLWTGRLRYFEIIDQVKSYMEIKKFPRELKKKVMVNYIYLFRKEYVGENDIIRLMSDNLQREILLRVHHILIQKVYLFSGLSQGTVLDIVKCIKPEIYMEGDVVFYKGDIADCMYFISFGTVAAYTKDNEEIVQFDDGNHFGEICLIFQGRRKKTVKAIETTELFRLGADDFTKIMKSYPAVYSKLEKMASERYEMLHAKEERNTQRKSSLEDNNKDKTMDQK